MYAKTLTLTGVEFRERDIETSLATTHVFEAGDPAASPVVLLHSFSFSSTVWVRNVAALAAAHRVIAIDIPGDMNLSTIRHRVKGHAGFRPWFAEVLDAVELPVVAIAGNSYGGWLAITFAIGLPERVSRIALVSPASFAKFRPLFMVGMVARAMTARSPAKAEAFARSFAVAGSLTSDAANVWSTQYGIAMPGWKASRTPTIPIPKAYDDSELLSIGIPVLLIEGESEPMYDPQRAFARAQRLVPSLRGEVMTGVAHVAQLEAPERINPLLVDFFA